MPDWSHAGYLGGQPLPGDGDVTGDASCHITPKRLASQYHVIPDDGADDTTGLQNAIDDIKNQCSPQADYHRLSLITLPSGRIDVSRQMYVDASFLIVRGQGSGAGGTKFVFRPDIDTRYDTVINGRWDQDTMVAGSGSDEGSGGWVWPGRGMFRVQTREVATRYQDDWAAAPANRKDLFEGSVNQHWVSGMKLSAQAGDPGFSARHGQSVVHLVSTAAMNKFTVGTYVWVGAANSRKFYAQQAVTGAAEALEEPLMMRQQMFHVAGIDAAAKTITLDRPLEWDLPVDSESDGSAPLGDMPVSSKVTPLKVVEGVGFEGFAFTQDMNGLPKLGGGTYSMTPDQAVNDYSNLAPEYAMHGAVFKWAANSWARGLTATMTGSHPIVTEDALNVQVERNSFDGAWNKGKGGNGYLRGSRVWGSLYAYNLSRNLRHFTFQWSASDNVAFRNDLDSDLNLHGGWEHDNLFEQNTVRVAYDHRSGSCTANCGGEGGEIDDGTWYPIWWAAGPKAIKWSGSSGPQNVFYNNTLIKQTTPGGPYVPYGPYGTQTGTAFQFGSDNADPSQFHHLSQDGQPIPDWGSRETLAYNEQGVVPRDMGGRPSLFLRDTGGGQIDPREVGDRPVASWNMQGSSSPNMDKWRTGVAYLADRADVVALQEAGSRPPPNAPGTATNVHDLAHGNLLIAGNVNGNPNILPPRIGSEVTHSIWQFGGPGFPQERHVYWLQTDRSANSQGDWNTWTGHVNLAIVSTQPADDVVIVVNQLASATGNHPYSARAALGIRIDDQWYFTLHGMSGNGNDDAGLLRNIDRFVDDQPLASGVGDWIALGDYNHLPDNNLAIPTGSRFYNTGQPTSSVFGQGRTPRELDYAVGTIANSGVLVGRVGMAPGDRRGNTIASMSDHVPVFVGPFRAAAEPTELYQDATVESMDGGGVLDVNNAATAEGTPVSSYLRNGDPNQRWTIQQYDDGTLRFVGKDSNRCLDYFNDTNPKAGEAIELWDCSNLASQRWMPEYLGNSEYQLHNMVDRDLCLNISGGQSDIHKAKRTILWGCENTPNERWIFTPSWPDTILDSGPWDFSHYVPGPITLESLKAGGVMDVSDSQTGNDSLVVQFHRNRQPNQGWNLDYVDGQTVTFRGVQSNRCLDIHNSGTAEAGRELVIWDCHPGQASQQWRLEQLEGAEVMLHSVAHPELCMDVHGDPDDPDQGYLDVWNCGSHDSPPRNQTWVLTPYDPSGSPVPDPDWDWTEDWTQ